LFSRPAHGGDCGGIRAVRQRRSEREIWKAGKQE
jgi:hypothetical protein